MGSGYFIAVDAGTTMLKAALARADGTVVDTARQRMKVEMPQDGWCEMDMEMVWQSFCLAIHTLRERNGDKWDQVVALGICAQGDGLWPIDSRGKPVRNAILWNDTRSGGLIDYTAINEEAVACGTTALFPGAGPVLLKWLKVHEPENFVGVDKILHCKDWLNYKLTGALCVDYTDASTALLNIYTKQYEFSLLEYLDLAECTSCFPAPVPSERVVGKVTAEAAQVSGVPEGVSVIAGALDVLAVAGGCELFTPGQRGSTIGTTLCNYVVLDEADAKRYASVHGSVLCHTREGTYIRLMAALAGSATLDWVQKEIMDGEEYPQLEAKLDRISIGSDGIMAHPYIFGERAPFRMPGASGGFFGIRAHHSKYHMARAAFEGMVLSIYDCYQYLPDGDGSIVVAGGAARSNFVCGMICDCMGEKTVRNPGKELGILGVIRLLQHSHDYEPHEAREEKDIFAPDMEAHNRYLQLYHRYCRYKEAMYPFWQEKTDGEI